MPISGQGPNRQMNFSKCQSGKVSDTVISRVDMAKVCWRLRHQTKEGPSQLAADWGQFRETTQLR
jgi:hypothetical protein